MQIYNVILLHLNHHVLLSIHFNVYDKLYYNIYILPLTTPPDAVSLCVAWYIALIPNYTASSTVKSYL